MVVIVANGNKLEYSAHRLHCKLIEINFGLKNNTSIFIKKEIKMEITEDWLYKNATESSILRGREIYQNQMVRPMRVERGFVATVYGSEDYEIVFRKGTNDFSVSCSCPYSFEGVCKHIVAVTLGILENVIEESPQGVKNGLSDLEKSLDANFFENYYERASEDLKAEFPRERLETNNSLRMRFLQALR